MNELEKLEAYHKYLSANAYMLQVPIMDWEGLKFEHLKQNKEIQLKAIKTHLDIYYETLFEKNSKVSTVVNKLFNKGLTPIMNYVQWNRSKQLDKLVNE